MNLINRVADGFHDLHIGVHVCRGNWSTKEGVLLEGGYEPLIPWLAKMKVNQFALEYATPRAGRMEAISGLAPGACLGLGTVNPRTVDIEAPSWIASRARLAADLLEAAANGDSSIPPGRRRVFLNPDCGFGTFADRPIATHDLAKAKLEALVAAAKSLR